MDPRALAAKKFIDQPPPGGLEVIRRYASDPPIAISTLIAAVREGLPTGEGSIVELGPGSGWFLEELRSALPHARLHALDMTPRFLDDLRRGGGGNLRLVRGDMERLPFKHTSFDIVTTNWTLYFMRGIGETLARIRRCLKPGCRLVAATVAPDHMHEFDAMTADCVRAVTGREPEPDSAAPFNTESGKIHMQRAFAHVELREWRGELTLPDVDSALALLPNWGPQDLSDERQAFASEFARRVSEIVRSKGRWRITRHDGAFVAIA